MGQSYSGSFGRKKSHRHPRSLIGSRRDVPSFAPRPRCLHKLTYQRLLCAMRRVLHELERLPNRRLHPMVHRRLETEFANRLGRIRRRLGLPVGRPRARTWYRTTDAARRIGVSWKTLVRWVRAGRVHCVRADTYKRPRYFHRKELARVIASLKV